MISEPVRLYLYGLLAPLVALLVVYGIVDETTAPLWLAFGTAVLGVTVTEAARRRVTPVANPRDDLGRPLTPDPM